MKDSKLKIVVILLLIIFFGLLVLFGGFFSQSILEGATTNVAATPSSEYYKPNIKEENKSVLTFDSKYNKTIYEMGATTEKPTTVQDKTNVYFIKVYYGSSKTENKTIYFF